MSNSAKNLRLAVLNRLNQPPSANQHYRLLKTFSRSAGTGQTRRQCTAEEKIRIVLEGLQGEQSVAEICRREGLNRDGRPYQHLLSLERSAQCCHIFQPLQNT